MRNTTARRFSVRPRAKGCLGPDHIASEPIEEEHSMNDKDLQPTDSQLSRRVAARGALSELARRYRRFRPRTTNRTEGQDLAADNHNRWAVGKVEANILKTVQADGHV
jgi:hypothetical protein